VYLYGCTTSREWGRGPRTGPSRAKDRVGEPDLAFCALRQQHGNSYVGCVSRTDSCCKEGDILFPLSPVAFSEIS
jgi:hypothetical protein